MPGMYAPGDYDLAGFCVGAVERGEALTGDRVKAGDVILGLASSGVHSNGFSLVRRLAADKGWKLDRPALFDQDRLLIEALLEPTRIYVQVAAAADPRAAGSPRSRTSPAAACSRISRASCPTGCTPVIDADAWPQPRLMAFLQAQGNIEPDEMARTFNCGIGMVAAWSRPSDVAARHRRRSKPRARPSFAIGSSKPAPARLHGRAARPRPGARARPGARPTMADKVRVAVLISGRGSNMAALARYAARQPDCPYEIVLVAANVPDARGPGRCAEGVGLPTWALSHKGMERADFDAMLDAALREARRRAMSRSPATCGCCRAEFVAQWEGRMLNIHPSLLPLHKGLDTHAPRARGRRRHMRAARSISSPPTRRRPGARPGRGRDPAARHAEASPRGC